MTLVAALPLKSNPEGSGFCQAFSPPALLCPEELAVDAFKRFPRRGGVNPRPLRARTGQKNKITRRWPVAARDLARLATSEQCGLHLRGDLPERQGCRSCPASVATQRPCSSISPRSVRRTGAHATLILDQAGGHTTPKLKVPDNMTLLFLPTKGVGVKYGREHLTVREGQLVVEPNLQRRR